MSSPYTFKPGGALKLKGDDKKKKKKSSTTTGVRGDVTTASKRTSESVSPAPASPSPGPAAAPRVATKAERKFEEVRMKRLKDEIRKEARKSHREKVEAFNAHLDTLTDINDLPKIGPG